MSDTSLASVPQSQVCRQYGGARCVRIEAPSGGPAARARRFVVIERGQRRYRQDLRPLGLERRVEWRQILGGERGELRADRAELCGESGDIVQLVARRRPVPGGNRTVELVGVLAQALLPGNRAALGGGDDLLANRVELGVEVAELARQRILLGAALARGVDLLAQLDDLREQRRLVVEQRVDLHRGLELRAAVGQTPRDAPVEAHLDLRVVGLAVVLHADGVGTGERAGALGGGKGQLYRGRYVRWRQMHGPDDAIQAAAAARRQLGHHVAAVVEYRDLKFAEHVTPPRRWPSRPAPRCAAAPVARTRTWLPAPAVAASADAAG